MFCNIERLSYSIKGNELIASFWHAFSRPDRTRDISLFIYTRSFVGTYVEGGRP